MLRVMLDLETAGVRPGCAVLSVGAMVFAPGRSTERNEFYVEICHKSSRAHGMEFESATMEWWAQQATEMPRGTVTLGDAMRAFELWVSNIPSRNGGAAQEVWANSPSFDCVILGEAMRRVGLTFPFHFSTWRDVRTLRALFPQLRLGNNHNALADATNQAAMVSAILEHLGTKLK